MDAETPPCPHCAAAKNLTNHWVSQAKRSMEESRSYFRQLEKTREDVARLERLVRVDEALAKQLADAMHTIAKLRKQLNGR